MFTAKTIFPFDMSPTGFDAETVANNVYTTAPEVQERLGDLARLNYLRATLKGTVMLSVAETVTLNVHLKTGLGTVKTVPVEISADTRGYFSEEVDLSGISGQTAMYIDVDVTSGASGTCLGFVFAKLECEMPLVIGSCQ